MAGAALTLAGGFKGTLLLFDLVPVQKTMMEKVLFREGCS